MLNRELLLTTSSEDPNAVEQLTFIIDTYIGGAKITWLQLYVVLPDGESTEIRINPDINLGTQKVLTLAAKDLGGDLVIGTWINGQFENENNANPREEGSQDVEYRAGTSISFDIIGKHPVVHYFFDSYQS